MAFKFERLNVWKKSLELSLEVHELTRHFPKEELFILTSQIKRAAGSVTLNITEGSTLQSDAEFSRFLRYANRSALEVVGCLYIGKMRQLIDHNSFERLYCAYENLVVRIQAMIRSLHVRPLAQNKRMSPRFVKRRTLHARSNRLSVFHKK